MKETHLKIWPTDKFFNDSPNAGETECICSRCHRHIKENEKVARCPVDETMFFTRKKDGTDQKDEIITEANGLEFRLCSDCVKEFITP